MKNLKMIMLLIEEATDVSIVTNTNVSNLLCYRHKNFNQQKEIIEYQHLYIIDTQAKIEVGDLVYSVKEDNVFVCPTDNLFVINERELYKVIASTDKDLDLQIIPEQLVQEYVQEQFEYLPEKYICRKCGGLAIDSKSLRNYHNIQYPTDGSKSEFEAKLEDCLKCSSCGHSWTNTNSEYNYEDYPMNPNPNVPNFITGKSQVDFEVIKNYDEILTHLENVSDDMCEKANNFKLFFDIISKLSSFAHKAHKELNKK